MSKVVRASTRLLASLTARELELVHWAARGLADKQIAAALGTSIQTVRNQFHSLYLKLRVHDRISALRVLGFVVVPLLPVVQGVIAQVPDGR